MSDALTKQQAEQARSAFKRGDLIVRTRRRVDGGRRNRTRPRFSTARAARRGSRGKRNNRDAEQRENMIFRRRRTRGRLRVPRRLGTDAGASRGRVPDASDNRAVTVETSAATSSVANRRAQVLSIVEPLQNAANVQWLLYRRRAELERTKRFSIILAALDCGRRPRSDAVEASTLSSSQVLRRAGPLHAGGLRHALRGLDPRQERAEHPAQEPDGRVRGRALLLVVRVLLPC